MRISDWSSDVCSSDLLAGAHEPVIDAATWERYRAARAERGRPQAARAERSPYLLVGFVRCMKQLDDGTNCEGRMTSRPGGRERSEERRVGKAYGSTCGSR